MTVSPTGDWWRPEWWGPQHVYNAGPPNVTLTDEQASWVAAALVIAGRAGTPKQLGRAVRDAAAEIRCG